MAFHGYITFLLFNFACGIKATYMGKNLDQSKILSSGYGLNKEEIIIFAMFPKVFFRAVKTWDCLAKD